MSSDEFPEQSPSESGLYHTAGRHMGIFFSLKMPDPVPHFQLFSGLLHMIARFWVFSLT